MRNERFWKTIFLTKSVITCTEGAALFFADSWLRYVLNAQPLLNIEYSQLFFGLVFWIGVTYWWVSRDIPGNHSIIKFGIGAQSLVFVLLAYHTWVGNVHPLYIVPGVIDLVFAILYSVFLFSESAAQSETSFTTSLEP